MSIEAWHFLSGNRRLLYGTKEVVYPGHTIRVDGPIELCAHGLHASRRGIDALDYAPGPIICRVLIGGEIVEGKDKIAGTERTVLWMADASEMLRDFAHLQALSVADLWDMPPVVRKYLMTGHLMIRAAARAAAGDAAAPAAGAANWAAAGAAAGDAARARVAAGAAARARAAAGDATCAEAAPAAGAANWAAAGAAANAQLERMAWALCGPETAQFPRADRS